MSRVRCLHVSPPDARTRICDAALADAAVVPLYLPMFALTTSPCSALSSDSDILCIDNSIDTAAL